MLDPLQGLVCLGDVARNVFKPGLLNVLVEVQIQLAVDDLQQPRVTIELGADRDAKGAEASVRRHVFVRIGFERLRVLSISKAVGGVIVDF